MNNWKFHFGRTWDDTSLHDLSCNPPMLIEYVHHIYVRLKTYDEAGGLDGGFDIDSFNRDQMNLALQAPLFPGIIEFDSAIGTPALRLENPDPQGNPEYLRVFLEGIDISDNIREIYINVDADANIVDGWYSYVTTDPITNMVILQEERFVAQ